MPGFEIPNWAVVILTPFFFIEDVWEKIKDFFKRK